MDRKEALAIANATKAFVWERGLLDMNGKQLIETLKKSPMGNATHDFTTDVYWLAVAIIFSNGMKNGSYDRVIRQKGKRLSDELSPLLRRHPNVSTVRKVLPNLIARALCEHVN